MGSEEEAIKKSRAPQTRVSLTADMVAAGVEPGQTLLVHTSLSALGWVCGGAVTVVEALIDALGARGTLVMPTHSSGNTDPRNWSNPPVPSGWWEIIRENRPGFDPRTTPSRGMGQVAELFRCWPDALRSSHPSMSFAALGPEAPFITQGHSLDMSLGERSPLARIHDLGGCVLLLGVDFDKNTSFHLSEYRAGREVTQAEGSAIKTDSGGRSWREWEDIDLNSDPFKEIGRAFEDSGAVSVSAVGCAEARHFEQRLAVEFATQWLRASAPQQHVTKTTA